MMTPQEAEGHVFPKASFGGYNMAQVDAFLDNLIANYRELFQENASLKGKLKVLVDKVEEYRATEEAMRRALHSAQKMAEELIREGEARKQATINEAVVELQRRSQETRSALAQEEAAIRARIEDAKAALANEELRLETARSSTTTFVDRLKELYAKELTFIGNLSELQAQVAPPPTPAAPAAPATAGGEQRMAQDIQANMAKILDEPAPVPDAAPDGPGDTRVFDQIEFGKDYEIE